ncbi:esterase E4-like [Contarinia nasturtii]|uniref:esterase E4-like n=1 Tax=Contarinia nasturtii TaxID=265458 RepID=UPI0012D44609|nr:esterase E4-like [Contarinia nasturtii]
MLSFKHLLILLSVIYFGVNCAPKTQSTEWPLVKTKSGELLGKIDTTLLDQREFYSFQGIPYAEAPIGALRFRAPRPIQPWVGVRNATQYGSKCLQTTFNLSQFWGEENCLFLNVYTPNLTPIEKMPVIFFVHGGGYMSGGSSWHAGDILLDEDIVLVTINYRLGPFGFLSLNTADYSGNMGLKDQLLALKWVNDNIEFFGGNKNSITMFGQSTGASSVHLFTLIPQTQSLYKRAIASSGSMLCPWSYSKKNHTQILQKLIADEKSTPIENISLNDIVEYLKNVDGPIFGERTFAPVYESGKSIKEIDLVWAPVIEIETGDDALLTRPIESYLDEKSDIDSLFGYTSAESIILAPTDINFPDGLKTFEERFEVQLPLIDLNYSYFSKDYDNMIKDVRQFYFGDKPVDANSLQEFVKLLSDVFFIYGIDKSVKAQAKRSTGKTFCYQFSVELELNSLRKTANASTLGLSGATHIEDMLYLFRMDAFIPESRAYDDFRLNTPEGQMTKKIVKFFTNFVKFGNPIPNNDPIEVKPVTVDAVNYVDLTNNGPIVGTNPHIKYIQFWDDFLHKYKDILQTPNGIQL